MEGMLMRGLPPTRGGGRTAHLWPSRVLCAQTEAVGVTKLSHDFIRDKHSPSDRVTRELLGNRTGQAEGTWVAPVCATDITQGHLHQRALILTTVHKVAPPEECGSSFLGSGQASPEA